MAGRGSESEGERRKARVRERKRERRVIWEERERGRKNELCVLLTVLSNYRKGQLVLGLMLFRTVAASNIF